MRRSYQVLAAYAAATLMLTSCGGGGSSAPQPHTATAQTAATAPPSAANRTSVGTAHLVLTFPKVVTATNGKHVRAIPRGAAKPRVLASGKVVSTKRPQYINPQPAASPGGVICGTSNILDIYVDGTIVPAIDNGSEAPDSLCVQQTGDGTQAVNLPLFSNGSNQIVAVEWDAADQNVLAIGEYDAGPFQAGVGVSAPLTMLMNVFNIGITDLAFSDPEIMNGQEYGEFDFGCPPSTGPTLGFYAADASGTFVPLAGSGGIPNVQATGTSDGGTSKFAQTTIPGVYNVTWDGACSNISVNASAPNPAFTIYNDVANYFQQNAYPGITFLWNNNLFLPNSDSNWFADQLNFSPGTGSVDLQNSSDT